MGQPEASDRLVGLLADADPAVRRAASQAIGRIEGGW
jgi:HEAT repeat protein